MGSNIELNVDDFSDERHYKNREESSFLVSRNSGLKKRKSFDHSEGTLANPSQNISSSVPKCQLSKGKEFEEDRPLTNDQILDFIEKEVALLKSVSRKKDDVEWQRGPGVSLPEKTENYPGLMSSCSPSQEECNRVKETPDTLSLLSKHVRQEREDSLKPVEVVGFDRVPGMTDGNRDANANTQTNIEDQQYCHVGSKEPPEHFCLNSYTEKIGIKNMQSVTINQSDQSVCSQTSSKNMEEDTTAMCLQANLSISLAVNKDGKIIPPCRPEGEDAFFVSVLNGPRYDGIPGAEDSPRLGMNLLNTKQEEGRFADPVYEDISEDESPQFQNTAEEMSSLPCDVPEDNAMLYELVQNQAKVNPGLNQERIPKEHMSPKTETRDLAQNCSYPCFVENDDGFEYVLCPKRESEKHLKWQAGRSFRPLSFTQHQEETEEAAEEEPSAKSKEKCGISASEKDLTDDQLVMLEVSAASCTTNEAESPVIITVGSGVNLPEKTENYPGLMSSCSASQEECNRVKETPDTLSLLSKHVRQEREDSLKPVEVVGFDRVPGMIDGNRDANAHTNIEDQQYCHVGSKEPPERFCLNSYTEKIGIKNMQSVTINQSDQSVCSQTSSKNMEENTTAMCLQANLSISLAVNKDGKIIPPCRPEGEDAFFVSILNGPRCDGIPGAEDSPRLGMNLLNTKQEEGRFADPVYEDISEDESPQFQNTAEEMPSLPCDVPEDNAMLYELVQNQAKVNPGLNQERIPKEQMSETCDLAQPSSCPCFVESDDGFEYVQCPKCDSEKHFRPLSVTQHQEETEETAEDDSEWLVIPINVKDVKWEAPDEDQVDGENISQCHSEHENQVKQSGTYAAVCEVPKSAPNQVSAAAFSPMEVFDTPTQQAKAMQSRERVPQSSLVPSSWSTAETKAHQPQNGESHCDSEDSCETEDSSDYSSDSERNYLTVPTQFLKNLSVPASPEPHDSDSDSEKENEDHKMANLQQCQTRGRSKSSGKDDIINLDSDTEDEDFQNCTETKTKGLFSTHTQNSRTACLNQVKKHSPEPVDGQYGTVKENLQTNGLQSTESPASHSQPRCHKEVIQTRNAPLSQRTEKCEHLLENKIASHLIKESYAQNISEDPSVIVIDSDDEGKQSNRQVKRKSMLASESMSRGSTSCGVERGDSEKKESAKPKDREPSVPSADSSKSQHQSKLQHMQLKEKTLDPRLLHSIKKRKLIKVRVRPDHFHQKPNRQIKSKTMERDIAKNLKSKTNVVLSETEDSDDALVDAHSSLSDSKNPQISLSSKDSSKVLSQSADRDVDSTKAHREHSQQKAKRKTASKTVEREMEKDLNKQKRTTRVLSSETEDSDDTLLYPQTSQPSMDYPQKQSVDTATDSIKVCHKHVQQKTNGHMTSKTMGRELEKDLFKHKRKTGILPSEMEDSDNTLSYAQTSLSSVDMPEKHPQTVDCDDDSTVAPNPVIPRLLVKKLSQSSGHLKLVEQSTVQKRGKNESQATPKTPTETSKKTDSSKKDTDFGLHTAFPFIPLKKCSMSDAHCTAPLPRSVDSSSSSRHHSSLSRLQRSDSNSSTTSTPTKGPSSSTSMQSSAKKQVFHDWEKSFVPTRRDRKKSLDSKRRTRNNCDLLRDARPGPSHHNKVRRWRRSSCESVPPLMKRPKYEAIQMTKSRRRDTPWERFPVSQDYKLKK